MRVLREEGALGGGALGGGALGGGAPGRVLQENASGRGAYRRGVFHEGAPADPWHVVTGKERHGPAKPVMHSESSSGRQPLAQGVCDSATD